MIHEFIIVANKNTWNTYAWRKTCGSDTAPLLQTQITDVDRKAAKLKWDCVLRAKMTTDGKAHYFGRPRWRSAWRCELDTIFKHWPDAVDSRDLWTKGGLCLTGLRYNRGTTG